MSNPILTLNRKTVKKKDSFSWNLKRNGNVVAWAAKYNTKQGMKKTIVNTILRGYRIDWHNGVAVVKFGSFKIKIIDNTAKKK